MYVINDTSINSSTRPIHLPFFDKPNYAQSNFPKLISDFREYHLFQHGIIFDAPNNSSNFFIHPPICD